jgi:VIT1/CCC1 family predicted Fe2+/Mn2+ transporter
VATVDLRRAVYSHLGSRQVARVIYGAIIGLALLVALERHPPGPGVVAGSLLATALAVALAEIYSEIVGTETRLRRRLAHDEMAHLAADALAVAFGIGFPVVFFVAAAAGVLETETAFTAAKWSGVGLISFYGFCAARLAGARLGIAVLQALAVGLVGALLIAVKALLH